MLPYIVIISCIQFSFVANLHLCTYWFHRETVYDLLAPIYLLRTHAEAVTATELLKPTPSSLYIYFLRRNYLKCIRLSLPPTASSSSCSCPHTVHQSTSTTGSDRNCIYLLFDNFLLHTFRLNTYSAHTHTRTQISRFNSFHSYSDVFVRNLIRSTKGFYAKMISLRISQTAATSCENGGCDVFGAARDANAMR